MKSGTGKKFRNGLVDVFFWTFLLQFARIERHFRNRQHLQETSLRKRVRWTRCLAECDSVPGSGSGHQERSVASSGGPEASRRRRSASRGTQEDRRSVHDHYCWKWGGSGLGNFPKSRDLPGDAHLLNGLYFLFLPFPRPLSLQLSLLRPLSLQLSLSLPISFRSVFLVFFLSFVLSIFLPLILF